MTAIERLKEADKTLSADGYNEWSYVRLAISEAIKAMTPTPTDAISAEKKLAEENSVKCFLEEYFKITLQMNADPKDLFTYRELIGSHLAYAKMYHTYKLSELAAEEVPGDEEIERWANAEWFAWEEPYKKDIIRACRNGAKKMRDKLSPVIASYRSSLSASERFRKEDAWSAINEANNLRSELSRLKAENEELKILCNRPF